MVDYDESAGISCGTNMGNLAGSCCNNIASLVGFIEHVSSCIRGGFEKIYIFCNLYAEIFGGICIYGLFELILLGVDL